MAAPTYVGAGTGTYDAGGAWSCTGRVPDAVGNIVVFHILQDGGTGGAVNFTTWSNIENLAGTDGAVNIIAELGPFSSAFSFMYVGRTINGSAPSVSGTNSTSEDLFMRWYEFTNVAAGTTLATILENGTAGTVLSGTGTTAAISDQGVTTLGSDRLAVNIVAVNDDNALDAFTGQTGGTWVSQATYVDATGTDGAIQLQTAAMPSAGTINGGTYTMAAADGWGVTGFAFIGTTVDTPVPRHGFVNFQDPGVL